MINFRNKQLAALTAIAGLGIGGAALAPAVAVAASHGTHATVVKTDPASPDRAGTKDGPGRDARTDKTSKLDTNVSVDRSTSVDTRTDR